MTTDYDDQPDDDEDDPIEIRIQRLIDLDIPADLTPQQRLLLAILRQSVIDFFGDDPLEQESAARYFARSPLYLATLQFFNLPGDLLPRGIEPGAHQQEERLDDENKLNALRLETLVRQLSGTQLKIVLTMGLLPLPVVTRKIALKCGLTRSTVLVALNQLTLQGLVVRAEQNGYAAWTLPEGMREMLDEIW